MKKYESTPEVLLHGTGFISIFISDEFEDFRREYDETLREYGVSEIEPDGWYPRQMYLDIFRRIIDRGLNASTNMISAGLRIIETIQLPPDLHINSMLEAVELLNGVYQIDQRNLPAGDIGYKITQEGPTHVRVVDLSPYPHDVNYGYIYGLLRRFRPADAHPVLKRTFLNEADPDSDGAIYDITW